MHYVSDSTCFAVSLDDIITVSFAGLGGGEVGNIFAAGWWAPDDLTDAVPLSNPQLPKIARPLPGSHSNGPQQLIRLVLRFV